MFSGWEDSTGASAGWLLELSAAWEEELDSSGVLSGCSGIEELSEGDALSVVEELSGTEELSITDRLPEEPASLLEDAWLPEQATREKAIVNAIKNVAIRFIVESSFPIIEIYSAREKVMVSRLPRVSKTLRSDVTLPMGITSTERMGLSVWA